MQRTTAIVTAAIIVAIAIIGSTAAMLSFRPQPEVIVETRVVTETVGGETIVRTVVQAPEPPALKGLTGEEREYVARLIEGAKREGALVVISNLIGAAGPPLASEFKIWAGLPPDFKVDFILLKSGFLVKKVEEELKAGKLTIDVVQLATIPWHRQLKANGHIREWRIPESEWEAYKHVNDVVPGANEPGYWISAVAYTFTPAWNPKFIMEEINDWEDVLNEEYKGKIVCPDIAKSTTMGQTYMLLKPYLGDEYFRRLASLCGSFELASEAVMAKVASGEYPLAWFGISGRAYAYKQVKVDLKVAFPKPLVILPTPMSLLTKAPHPNAAELWMRFYLTPTAQQLMARYEGFIPLRKGVESPDPDLIPPVELLLERAITWSPDDFTVEDISAARQEWKDIMGY